MGDFYVCGSFCKWHNYGFLLHPLQNVPAIHLFNAWFKEKIGDRCGARAAFLLPDKELNSDFMEKVVKEANMEKRLVCNLFFLFSRSGVMSFTCNCTPHCREILQQL